MARAVPSSKKSKVGKKERSQWRPDHILERLLFAGRWFLAPIYVGLLAVVVIIVIKFFEGLVGLVGSVGHLSYEEIIIDVLSLIDISLLGNLLVLIIFSGYENFVSKINVAEKSEDRPSWMGKLDFSGLKIKIIGSIVAISLIELLADFVHFSDGVNPAEGWRIGLHLTFVISGVFFTLMEYLSAKTVTMEAGVKHAAKKQQ